MTKCKKKQDDLVRGPGTLKILRSGMRGRSRKKYNLIYPKKADEEVSVLYFERKYQ